MTPKPYSPPINHHFIGREYELEQLRAIGQSEKAAIVIMYGRRRVGKTELLEQAYHDRNILKFEGIEGQDQSYQRKRILEDLSEYSGEAITDRTINKTWGKVFKEIAKHTTTGTWTIYFEEVQWLADYKALFISELKSIWDNAFRHNPNIVLILCGSSPSFMINHVANSRALYNRSQHEFHLQELTLAESKKLLNKPSDQEVMDTYLSIGGIPEYLFKMKESSSSYLSLCQHSFKKNGFFVHEYKRIFVSSMQDNPHYKNIIAFLAARKFASRSDIVAHLGRTSGGVITKLLTDLEICGFIRHYVPYNKQKNSKLARYSISDYYLQYYFKFLDNKISSIEHGDYDTDPTRGLNHHTYQQWLGFAFERFCIKNHTLIAKLLGFSAVNYTYGPYFDRSTIASDKAFQIDLLYQRTDKVITMCEIKYINRPVTKSIIEEFDRKLEHFPNKENLSIHKVLICANGVDENLKNSGYFDNIITLDDFF